MPCWRLPPAQGGWRDVVVGYIETHGRVETETLLQGLEVLRAGKSNTGE